MRITVDKSKCSGHARCHAEAPEVFPIDDDGFTVVTTLDVSPELEDQARAGALMCPERAIAIEDD